MQDSNNQSAGSRPDLETEASANQAEGLKNKSGQRAGKKAVESQKKASLLKVAGGVGAVAVLGALAVAAMPDAENPEEGGSPAPGRPAAEGGFSGIVGGGGEDKPFETAFADARTEAGGGGGVFINNGNIYNTYIREEWDSMTQEQRDAFAQQVSQYINEHRPPGDTADYVVQPAETEGPETEGPESQSPETEGPETQSPETEGEEEGATDVDDGTEEVDGEDDGTSEVDGTDDGIDDGTDDGIDDGAENGIDHGFSGDDGIDNGFGGDDPIADYENNAEGAVEDYN
jgi:hypothetical protein